MGKVYMTFGKAISMKDYLAEKNLSPLRQDNLDKAALELTTHLVLQQEYASPVVLNMIVAAILLQSSTVTITFSSIYSACKSIYNYLVKRGGVKMIMREPPSRISVLDTVKKLGFKVVEIAGGKERTRRIKDYTVDLEAKRD